MSPLLDPDCPAGDPFAAYHHNLTVGQSMTWYTATSSPRDLIGYVLGLLHVEFDDLLFDELGFAKDKDQAILLIAITNDRGCALTVWGFGDAGELLLNGAVQGEWQTMMDDLRAGTFTGNAADARSGGIMYGRAQDDDPEAEAFDFINGGVVVPVFDAHMFNAGARPA